MITVIDYGRGNLFSIGQALRHVGVEFVISSDPADVDAADGVILPGVGAFEDCMKGIVGRGFVDPLLTAVGTDKPVLGICVGCQVLLSQGEEFGTHTGLGIIDGVVGRLRDPDIGDRSGIRIPNVGWRPVDAVSGAPLLGAIPTGSPMYFVHSFVPRVVHAENAAAYSEINGEKVPVAVHAGSVVGVQFHPEKSGDVGLGLLSAFAEQCRP